MIECSCCGETHNNHEWLVRSDGPHSWLVSLDQRCSDCWSREVQGDGHSYSGAFATAQEAAEHAAFLSGVTVEEIYVDD